MNKKHLLALSLTVAIFSLAFSACGDGETHKHTYSEEWSYDETGHWHAATCEHTDQKDGVEEHELGEWTLLEGETCKYVRSCACGYSEEKTEHKPVAVAAVAATCERTGLTEGSVCEECGEVIEEQQVTPKIAHEFEDGICITCGAPDPDAPDTDGLVYSPVYDGDESINVIAYTVSGSGTSGRFVKIPATYNGFPVTGVASYAFANSEIIECVVVPDSVTEIQAYAFAWSPTLRYVSLGSATVGDGAFSQCTALTTVVLGDGVESIGDYAFYSCKAIQTVYYGGTQADWSAVTVGSNNTRLKNAAIYYYSEQEPALDGEATAYVGDFWHYDGQYVPAVWIKEE